MFSDPSCFLENDTIQLFSYIQSNLPVLGDFLSFAPRIFSTNRFFYTNLLNYVCASDRHRFLNLRCTMLDTDNNTPFYSTIPVNKKQNSKPCAYMSLYFDKHNQNKIYHPNHQAYITQTEITKIGIRVKSNHQQQKQVTTTLNRPKP